MTLFPRYFYPLREQNLMFFLNFLQGFENSKRKTLLYYGKRIGSHIFEDSLSPCRNRRLHLETSHTISPFTKGANAECGEMQIVSIGGLDSTQ